MNEIDFSGRTVMVVGGSSGIGNGIARCFHDHGATVFVSGTRPNPADYKKDDDGSDFSGLNYFQWDVSNDGRVKEMKAPFERLDVLVLSQGAVIYGQGEFESTGFRQVIDVNLVSVMNCCVKFHDMLAASKGSIIVIGSSACFRSTKGNPAYSASKGGVLALTRTLAEAWARDGIRVNGVAPGVVATKMTKVTWNHPRRFQDSVDKIPLHRWGTPEDMGGVALFLASPLAAFVTGEMILTDGGQSLA
jgi:3-oxoacyl-[acyl-carrier protein] reductase